MIGKIVTWIEPPNALNGKSTQIVAEVVDKIFVSECAYSGVAGCPVTRYIVRDEQGNTRIIDPGQIQSIRDTWGAAKENFCTACNGSGWVSYPNGTNYFKCTICGGTGIAR